MLRHLGARRSPKHNIRLAVLLGLTAGMVNAVGFLGFAVLTTNVTGHAALFAEKVAAQDWHTAQIVATWMLLFLAGAFVSSLILSLIGANQRYSFFIPLLIEIFILLIAAIYGNTYDGSLLSQELFAGSLLFAMGIQNALVSMISGSAVRTTHLTGTFTDLGIELALAVTAEKKERTLLGSKIRLKLTIIIFFMTGAVFGAYLFHHFRFHSFYAPIFILCFVMGYDILRIKAKRYYRTAAHSLKI